MLACYYWSSTILSRGINFRSRLREVMIKININNIHKDLNLELRRWSENEIEWKGLELYAQCDSRAREMWEIKKEEGKKKWRREGGEIRRIKATTQFSRRKAFLKKSWEGMLTNYQGFDTDRLKAGMAIETSLNLNLFLKRNHFKFLKT
jgi:hypothetical protein